MNEIQVGQVFKAVEFQPETYCDGQDVVHNHFECPVCGDKDAGTNIYMSIDDWINCNGDRSFKCERCNSTFELLVLSDDWDIKLLKVGDKLNDELERQERIRLWR